MSGVCLHDVKGGGGEGDAEGGFREFGVQGGKDLTEAVGVEERMYPTGFKSEGDGGTCMMRLLSYSKEGWMGEQEGAMPTWYTASQTLHIWSVRDGHYGSMVYCVTDIAHLVCERWALW